ncbi:uncharacterized protein [Parasteatoda tepidariorum]|uniref:uncharacterized protein isoform X1 n=2 Tax=Parasteatoda tepidariorum TaxID=114398 RepID=UPI001C71D0C2|nr:uncharacterized protein LOC107450740 isoform X1 [Parasteatoda tepidariorum]XP_015922106.2 uncharacterized protein LOC107450740 isoform X1 [Parasteatoda tepidariorum]
MLNWYIEKQELRCTPSILDGFDTIKEAKCRKEGARFIQELGKQMGLGCATIATGIVYFQRFYLSYSFKSISKYLAACCCLFLSGKVEETPKRAKDIIRTAKEILTETEFKELGENPKGDMMKLENVLLKSIQFNFNVAHPYNCILKYAKRLKGRKEDLEKLVQSAWIFVNDSLCTTICIQWQPEVIAVASLHLASKINRFEIDDWENRKINQCYWWEAYAEGFSIKMIEGICHELLDMYTSGFDSSQEAVREAETGSNDKSETNTVCCVESETFENENFETETLGFVNELQNKHGDETIDSILNIDVPSRERKIPSNYNNILYKPTTATSSLKLNEDVWNILKKIQVTDTTPANIVLQQNILSTSCYYNMSLLNSKDIDSKLGRSNNNSYNTTDLPVSQSNTNHTICNNSNSFSYNPLPSLKHSVSIQEFDLKSNKLCVLPTSDTPMFSKASYQNVIKEINNSNMHLRPLLPNKLHPALSIHRANNLFPFRNSNVIPPDLPIDRNSSLAFSNYSLLQTVTIPQHEHSDEKLPPSSVSQPFCLPQNLHSVSNTVFQNEDFAWEENNLNKSDFNAPSASTEVLYSQKEISYLPEDPPRLEEESPYMEGPAYLPEEASYLQNRPSYLLEKLTHSPVVPAFLSTPPSGSPKGLSYKAAGSSFQFAIPKVRNKKFKTKRNFSKVRPHVYHQKLQP